MDFRQLEYLCCIAKHGSMTKAAQELYVSQPSLSKFLQNLERHVGIPLFHRIRNRFVPTYAGERFLAYARQLLLIKKDLDDELREIVSARSGRLRIAIPSTLGAYLLPDVLPVFRKQYPDVVLDLLELPTEVIEEHLLDGSVDLAIFNAAQYLPALRYHSLCRQQALLVLSPDHPLAKHATMREGCKYPWIDLRLFAQEPFILFSQGQHMEQIGSRLLTQADIQPPVALRTRTVENAVRLAAARYGVCFTLELYIHYLHLDSQPLYLSVGNPKDRI